jgi:glycosyltransferase involved in cell wall biosynthesis
MRLLVCTPWFEPARAFGGTVAVSVATVKGALAAGHEVTVATTDMLDHHARVAPGTRSVPGARVLRFPNVSHRLATTNVPQPQGMRRWLRANVGEFDVVLLQDLYSAVSVAGARAAVRVGVPYVVQPMGTLPPTPERGRARAKRAFLALWGRRTLKEATLCLAMSEAEHDEYLAQGVESGRVQAMPPPLELPDPGHVSRASVPTVIYLGQQHPIKRIDVLLEAFARVRRELTDARLEVVGPPSRHGRELEAVSTRLGLGDAVAFRGLIPEEEKGRALARAHVFALLSAAEGLPVAALEAMACGTPVVLSPGCGLPEVDGVAGIVCDGSASGAA